MLIKEELNIAAVIIVFKPNIEDLYSNILKIIEEVDKLILWFNSKCDPIKLPPCYEDKIVRLGDGKNRFISEPLNIVTQYCLNNNIDYLLTMDQDSEWEDLHGFLKKIKVVDLENVAIYAPNINNSVKHTQELLDSESVITSGSFCNVKTIVRLGGFREDYEIYWVDGEFCFWARLNGYRIICLPQYNLKHKFGSPTPKRFGIVGSNYSPIVYFYLFRNMFWMHREYGSRAVSIKTILYSSKMYGLGVVFCEKNKLIKIYKILEGVFQGLFYPIKVRKNRLV